LIARLAFILFSFSAPLLSLPLLGVPHDHKASAKIWPVLLLFLAAGASFNAQQKATPERVAIRAGRLTNGKTIEDDYVRDWLH
jgi:hypothetical protein